MTGNTRPTKKWSRCPVCCQLVRVKLDGLVRVHTSSWDKWNSWVARRWPRCRGGLTEPKKARQLNFRRGDRRTAFMPYADRRLV